MLNLNNSTMKYTVVCGEKRYCATWIKNLGKYICWLIVHIWGCWGDSCTPVLYIGSTAPKVLNVSSNHMTKQLHHEMINNSSAGGSATDRYRWLRSFERESQTVPEPRVSLPSSVSLRTRRRAKCPPRPRDLKFCTQLPPWDAYRRLQRDMAWRNHLRV